MNSVTYGFAICVFFYLEARVRSYGKPAAIHLSTNHMKTKYIAGISLAIMAVGFLVTLPMPDTVLVKLLQGGFEAGLVGGIADWFAVTALFRHPFGIPIPHTSLLLKNKDKIVNSLISAMENELMNKESIIRRLRGVNVLNMAASESVRLVSRRSVRIQIMRFLIASLKDLPLEGVAARIQVYLADGIRSSDMKPIVGRIAAGISREEWDLKALDYILSSGAEWAARPETKQMLGELAHGKLKELQVGGLMGFAVQAVVGFMDVEKLGALLQNMLLNGIEELSRPQSSYRHRILDEIRRHVERALEQQSLHSQLKEWLVLQVESPDTAPFILGRLEALRNRMLDTLEEDIQKGGRLVLCGFRFAFDYLKQHHDTIEKWEAHLVSYLVGIVEANHYKIGDLVRDNLNQLDDQSLIRMLEERIGSDLQWIRVNGALCGFAVGILLALFQL